MTLNVDLLRQVQVSIADESKKFNMRFWGQCIHGHAARILGIDTRDEKLAYYGGQAWTHKMKPQVIRELGLSPEEAGLLFNVLACTRSEAIAAIDALIASHSAPELEGTGFLLPVGGDLVEYRGTGDLEPPFQEVGAGRELATLSCR